MSEITLKKSKLEALRQHILADGANDLETVATVLGLETDDAAGVKAYVNRLRQTDPELFTASPEPATKEVPDTEIEEVRLIDELNVVHEMDIVRRKGSKLFVRYRIPRDPVTIKIRGTDVEVDLIELTKADPSEVRHGLTVSVLRMLAEAAKA